MEPTIPDANQSASSTGTIDAKPTTAEASSAQATPASDSAPSMEQVVRDALAKHAPSQGAEARTIPPPEQEAEGTPATEPTPGEGEQAATPKEGEEEPTPAKPEEESKGPVPYERFSEAIAEKNEAVQKLEELQPQVQDYQQIVGFLDQHNLGAEDFQWALRLAAAKRNNPDDYFKMLQPDIDQLGQLKSGSVLDNDLKQALDAGEISAEWAQKVQAGRAKESFQQRNAQAQMEAQKRQQFVAYQQSMTNATTDWAKSKQSTDPDFQPSKKGQIGLYEAFCAHLHLATTQQVPKSPEQIKALCDKVYAQVKPLFRSAPKASGGPQLRASQATPTPKGKEPTNIREMVVAGIENYNRQVASNGRH